MDLSLREAFGRRVRIGMVGGGTDSYIGSTHLMAMRVDGLCEFVAGVMSIDPSIARSSALRQFVASDRIYTDYRVMAEKEAARPDRIDAVVVATPPRLHLAVAKEFLERGFDVICEKPMTYDLSEARELADVVKRTGRLFCLTHCYSGYPMVREARAMVRGGAIGAVRMIEGEYSIGNTSGVTEIDDPTRRHWRFRADQAGKAGLLGEAGSHAYHMACYISGLRAYSVSAVLSTFAPRREVYDNAYIMARFEKAAQGRLWYSYVAAGNDHGLTMKIYGETGSLVWWQEEGEVLWYKPVSGPAQRVARGYETLSPEARAATRITAGHSEGYVLAFANLYTEFAEAIMARALSRPFQSYLVSLPSVDDGVSGLALVEAAVQSNNQGNIWVQCAA
jgi:predicted dehydrogenase